MLRENEPLANHTRFGLGGPADQWIDCETAAEFIDEIRRDPPGLLVLGGGTNLLAADAGYRGTVVRYTGRQIRIEDTTVVVDSGADLEDVVRAANAAGLAGLESMMRIPGWVSGAIYGNAGAYGQSIQDVVEAVEIFDGRDRRWLAGAECGFAYRTSAFKSHREWKILTVRLKLSSGDPVALAARSEEIRAIRDEKFPVTLRCAGSIFKNCLWDQLSGPARAVVPSGLVRGGKVPAAFFLEQIGAKGLVRGGIRVADYHANLLYNDGTGTAAEAVGLIDSLIERVADRFGFRLEEEVQYVGFTDRQSH